MLGAIGAGKTHVARRIAALVPARVVDADGLAHEALAACARDGRLAGALGAEFVTPDGGADRARLAEAVFRAPETLGRLEALLHPLVLSWIEQAVQNHGRGEGPPVLVLDVPLLLESGLDASCDALWLVDADPAVRRERAGRRGLSGEQVERREQNQRPLAEKRARADRVIRNDVGEAELDREIRSALQALGIHAR